MAKNDDGFEAGAQVSNDELYQFLAKSRLEESKPKRGRPAKDQEAD